MSIRNNVFVQSTFLALSLAAALAALNGCAHRAGEATGGTAATASAESDDFTILHFSQEKGGVPQPGQRVFASPEQAVAVLKDAIAARDRRTLVTIFGPEGKELIFSGATASRSSTTWMPLAGG